MIWGASKQILGMRITRDKKNKKLTFPQSEYIEKVSKIFNMQNAKPVSIPLVIHFKLSKEVCPKAQEEMAYMSKFPYASAVGILMYAMFCTRPNIAHAVGVVSRYMNNPGKEHWITGEVDSQVFERYRKSRIMLCWFKHFSIGIC